ncbi:hypothetical protein JT06_16780, partial [Desulfobulbus sp. Tol-SR]
VSSNTALAKVLAASEQIFDAPVLELLTAAKTGTPATVAQTTAMSVENAASKIQNLPAFKKWFKGSKVVDENGAPLVVYHGTNNGFAEFSDKMKSSKTGNPNAQLGYFFTESPKEASRYTEAWGKANGRVIPAYLSISNPYTMPYAEFNKLSMGAWTRITEKSTKPEIIQAHAEARKDAAKRKDELVAQGYDGVVTKVGGVTEYIAFDPTQIKSIFNQTWDGSNPDIAMYGSVESQMISSLNTAVKDARATAANALASLNNPKDALHDKWLQHAPKVLAVTPLSHLAQTYGKTIHWIKDLAKHTNELEATTTRLIDDFFAIHEEAVKAAESETGIDKFNRAMLVATFNQMNPTKELSKQDWVSDKLPPGQQIVAAQKSWVDAGMQKATGMTFTQAYAEAKKEYDALGPKT